MILDNENFTEEQRKIIRDIGEKHKSRRSLYFRKLYIKSGIIVIILLLVLFFLYSVNSNNTRILYVLSIMGLISGLINFNRERKNINNKLSENSYIVGLNYADLDEEVKGNAQKLFRQIRIGFISAGFFGLVFSIVGVMWGLQVTQVEYDNLTEVVGILEEGYMDSDSDILMRLENDEYIYRIDSTYTNMMDVDKLFDEVDLGDEVIFNHGDPYDGSNDSFKEVFYYEANSKVYMDLNTVQTGNQRSLNSAIALTITSLLVSIGSFVGYFVYKNKIIANRMKKEIFDLSTSSTFLSIDENDAFEVVNLPKVETFAPVWMKVLIIFLTSIVFLGLLAVLIFLIDPTYKLIFAIFTFILLIISLIGCYDAFKNNEIIDGNYYYATRFHKKIKFHLKEISKVTMSGQYVLLLDINGKTLSRLAFGTGNLESIVERLKAVGIVVEVNNNWRSNKD